MNDKEKIIKYLTFKKLSKNKFYKKTGLGAGFLDSGSSLGVDKLRIILDNYPDLNPSWFMNSEGQMIRNENEIQTIDQPSILKIPYYNIDFMAGFDLLENNQQVDPDNYISDPLFIGSDYVVRCSGDSMSKAIPDGAYVGIRQIPLDEILYGQVYGIVTDYWRTIKYIKKSKVNEAINVLLVPENKENYDDQELKKSKILSVWQVIAYGSKLN